MQRQTQVNGAILETIELIKPSANGNVADEVINVIIFLCHMVIKFKHLLSVSKKTDFIQREHRQEI